MIITVNAIKRCACETLNQVPCSITMNVKLLGPTVVHVVSVQSFQLASAIRLRRVSMAGWRFLVHGCGLK